MAGQEDSIITEFLVSIGPWSKFIIIGGGYAPIIYKLYLGENDTGNPPVGTRDIDSLISRRVPKISEKSIAKHLQDAGFAQSFKDYGNPATESYSKEINGVEIEIEFLTDDSTREDKHKNVNIPGTGVTAQQLQYIQMSLENTKEFRTLSGKLGHVVSPGAWIFHKGLTFPKRNDKMKKYKDLYGIWYVVTQLGELSKTAIKELAALSNQNSQWFKTYQKNLGKWLDSATPQDWVMLESQDPYGALRKEFFEDTVQLLINKRS